jgi:hypothetical protein
VSDLVSYVAPAMRVLLLKTTVSASVRSALNERTDAVFDEPTEFNHGCEAQSPQTVTFPV